MNNMRKPCSCERQNALLTIIVDWRINVAKTRCTWAISFCCDQRIQRIGRFLGHKVIADVHLRSWDFRWAWSLRTHDKPELAYFDEYRRVSRRRPFAMVSWKRSPGGQRKSDEEFSARAHEATLKLQVRCTACLESCFRNSLKKNYGNLRNASLRKERRRRFIFRGGAD